MKKSTLFLFAWFIAIIATLGSLFFSEVLHLVPCVLCWYQRIALYPMVIILAIGIWRKDSGIPLYILPLSIIGLGIAKFHWLLQMGIIPDELGPCVAGVSCTTKSIEYFGFVTIPFMAMIAFLLITVAMVICLMGSRNGDEKKMGMKK